MCSEPYQITVVIDKLEKKLISKIALQKRDKGRKWTTTTTDTDKTKQNAKLPWESYTSCFTLSMTGSFQKIEPGTKSLLFTRATQNGNSWPSSKKRIFVWGRICEEMASVCQVWKLCNNRLYWKFSPTNEIRLTYDCTTKY